MSKTNAGVRVQVSIGSAWDVSGNASQSKGDGKSSTVNQQSGLFAGDGGYHVTADTIDLKGGAIGSTNATNSELTTNAITFQNIENKMEYKADSASIAGGFGGTSTNADGSSGGGMQSQKYGDAGNPTVSAGLPMQDKGSASSTTYATLTDGKLTIGGQSLTSAKDLGAHTDLQTANQAIALLPNLKGIVADQQAMAAAAGTVIATAKQVAGDIAGKAAKEGKAAQDVLDNDQSTPQQKQDAQLALDSAKQAQKDWGPTGDNSRALNVVTGILVGSVAGQGATQIAANASAPYAAKAIGDYFAAPGHENQSAQLLSHAVLGAVLAAANGSSTVGGASAGAAGELAAQVISRELYPKAYDPDGSFHPDRLNATETNTVIALSTGVGALVAGATGGSLMDAAVGSNIAANASDE